MKNRQCSGRSRTARSKASSPSKELVAAPQGKVLTPRDFCYWLQGYLDVSGAKKLDAKQLALVKSHLSKGFFPEAHAPKSSLELQGILEGLRTHHDERLIC